MKIHISFWYGNRRDVVHIKTRSQLGFYLSVYVASACVCVWWWDSCGLQQIPVTDFDEIRQLQLSSDAQIFPLFLLLHLSQVQIFSSVLFLNSYQPVFFPQYTEVHAHIKPLSLYILIIVLQRTDLKIINIFISGVTYFPNLIHPQFHHVVLCNSNLMLSFPSM